MEGLSRPDHRPKQNHDADGQRFLPPLPASCAAQRPDADRRGVNVASI
jgi:hypothetical protein